MLFRDGNFSESGNLGVLSYKKKELWWRDDTNEFKYCIWEVLSGSFDNWICKTLA